jgi:hypothetical protein
MKKAVEMVRLIDVLIPDTHFEMIPADVRKNKPAKMFYSLLFKVRRS